MLLGGLMQIDKIRKSMKKFFEFNDSYKLKKITHIGTSEMGYIFELHLYDLRTCEDTTELIIFDNPYFWKIELERTLKGVSLKEVNDEFIFSKTSQTP